MSLAHDSFLWRQVRPDPNNWRYASLRDLYPCAQAITAGVADHVWTLEEIAGLSD